jgi:hypothetical protein
LIWTAESWSKRAATGSRSRYGGSRTSEHAHHGIRYSLTLHDKYGTRVLGYENAHAVKPPKKFKFAGQRLPYDHRHRSASDKGEPYAFESAYRLLEDFFAEVDRVIKEAQQ